MTMRTRFIPTQVLAGAAAFLAAFSYLYPGEAPKALKPQTYTEADIRSGILQDRKQSQYVRMERAASKLFRSYGCKADLAPATARAAVDLGINIRVLTALIFVESSCRKDAISNADAVGPMQINHRVWRTYSREELLNNPELNITVGAEILSSYVRRYGLKGGLHAYNGFGDPTSEYGDKILQVAGLER